MARTQRRFDAAFQAKVALEALRELKTIIELAKQFRVHTSQVTLWNEQLLSTTGRFSGIGIEASTTTEFSLLPSDRCDCRIFSRGGDLRQFISLARFGRFGSAKRPIVSSSVNFDLHRMRGCNPLCDKKSSLHRPSAMRKEAEFAVPLRLFAMRFIAWPANRNRSPSGPQRFRWFESNSCHLGGLSLSLGVSAQRSSLSPALMRNSIYQQ